MSRKKYLSPSLLSADFSCLAAELRRIEEAGSQYLHLDVMDGHFVPNITFGPPVVKKLRPVSRMVFDVHLMIEHPDQYLKPFAEAGADIINVHQEVCPDLLGILTTIREEYHVRPAVTIKPKTPVAAIRDALPLADIVMVMTVEPGFGGQKLIPECVDKVRELARLRDELGLSYLIEVDGGVTLDNAKELLDAGVDVLVAGSAVFGAKDPAAATREFLKRMAE